MIHARIHIHTYLHTTVCVCAWIQTYWNIIKQLLNCKGDTGLPDIFLIDGNEIKDHLSSVDKPKPLILILQTLDQH